MNFKPGKLYKVKHDFTYLSFSQDEKPFMNGFMSGCRFMFIETIKNKIDAVCVRVLFFETIYEIPLHVMMESNLEEIKL